jgi:hypothetical protein
MSSQPPHGVTQEDVLAAIEPCPENPRIWAAVYFHRQACVRYLVDFVLKRLEDPALKRTDLKQELIALASKIEENGPPPDD